MALKVRLENPVYERRRRYASMRTLNIFHNHTYTGWRGEVCVETILCIVDVITDAELYYCTDTSHCRV